MALETETETTHHNWGRDGSRSGEKHASELEARHLNSESMERSVCVCGGSR